VDGAVTIPHDVITPNLESLINEVYGTITDCTDHPPPDFFAHRMILAARNSDIDGINDLVLGHMRGEEKRFISADHIIQEQEVGPVAQDGREDYPIEFLRALNASGLPPGELSLKVGCPLILLHNLAPNHGLCNGTRMILTRMSERVLEVKILGGDWNGQTAFIPRISLTPTADSAEFTFMLR